MRHFKIAGLKIKLLPPPFPPEEDLFCGKCQNKFDTNSKRRACFDLCGHLSCLKCIFKMSSGCVECIASETELNSKSSDNQPHILVLSSVLAKPSNGNEGQNSDEDDDETFPEIQRLSLSELPVLDCMSTFGEAGTSQHISSQEEKEEDFKPIVITLDDEEDEEVNVEVDEEDDDIQEVPVEEYTKLAGEEERNGQENEDGFKVELQFETHEENEVEEDKCDFKPENVRMRGRRKQVLRQIEEKVKKDNNSSKFIKYLK